MLRQIFLFYNSFQISAFHLIKIFRLTNSDVKAIYNGKPTTFWIYDGKKDKLNAFTQVTILYILHLLTFISLTSNESFIGLNLLFFATESYHIILK